MTGPQSFAFTFLIHQLLYYSTISSLATSSFVKLPTKYLTRVEAGSNASTVTLRVVRGDEMGLKKAVP
jgi:hypothetical protein